MKLSVSQEVTDKKLERVGNTSQLSLERLTTTISVVIFSNMSAQLVTHERHQVSANAFAEILVWRVPRPVRGYSQEYKYALAFIVEQHCVLRYDNEAGKGDHRHIGSMETPYQFSTPKQLLADFWHDVDNWRSK